jgi:guanylate kinase
MFVIISGSSGVGKNTIINRLLEKYGDLKFMPTFTTREKRENEYQGNPYFFVSVQEFQAMIDNEELFEHQITHNNYYGVSKKLLLDMAASGATLIKDIDVLGTANLQRALAGQIQVLAIFYYVASKDVLAERLRERGEQEIGLRMERYSMEMGLSEGYDYLIENKDIEKTLSLTRAVIDFESNHACLLSAQAPAALDRGAIGALMERAKGGERLSGVDVAINGKDVCVVDGLDRYLASAAAGAGVAKRLVDYDFAGPPYQLNEALAELAAQG